MSVPVFSGWFTFSGRRNRLSFLWIFLIFFVIDLVLLTLLLGGGTGLVVWFVLEIPLRVLFCILAAQRIRDFGFTGWLVLLFIPLAILDQYIYVATLVAMIIILVIPGTKGDNRYGPDPLSLAIPPDGPVSHETHPASSRAASSGSPRVHSVEVTVNTQDSNSLIDEIERLDGLRKGGAISEEEFERLKRRLIDSTA